LSIKGPQRPAWDKFGAHSQDVIANPEIIFIKRTFASGSSGPGLIGFLDLAQACQLRLWQRKPVV
jgi:hypothetical protein